MNTCTRRCSRPRRIRVRVRLRLRARARVWVRVRVRTPALGVVAGLVAVAVVYPGHGATHLGDIGEI